MPLKNPVTGGTWTTAPLNSSFVATGGTYLTPAYRKDSLGIVHLRGRASYVSGTPATILTLPTGFRPTGSCRFFAPATDASNVETLIWMDMRANGNLDYANGSSTTISFDQISFATY